MHTPGPWSVWPTPDDPNHTHKIMYDCVQTHRRVGAVAGVFPKEQDGEQEANARLMAAAPLLLETCVSVCDALDRAKESPQSDGNRLRFTAWKLAIQVAINAAEGTNGEDRRVD